MTFPWRLLEKINFFTPTAAEPFFVQMTLLRDQAAKPLKPISLSILWAFWPQGG